MEHLKAIGEPSTFVCPDCRGVLWQVRDSKPLRYRCHTGHAFTIGSLQHVQSEAANEALWSAVRALQEKELILATLGEQLRGERDDERARSVEAIAAETHRQAGMLRALAEAEDPAGERMAG